MERIKGLRPSYAGVTATLALVLALGMGGAYAANQIGSKQIAPSAVKSKHIKDGQVKTPDLAEQAVDGAKIADDAVSGAKIAPAAVGGPKLGGDAVNSSKIQDGQVRSADLGPVNIRSGSVQVPPNGIELVAAQCGPGETLLSGGGLFDGVPGTKYLSSSFPSGNSWLVHGRNYTSAPATVRAYALCLAP